MAANRKNIQRTIDVLKNLKKNEYFSMSTHQLELDDCKVASAIGYAATKLDLHNLLINYFTLHLVNNSPTTRWRSWAFDFYNIKGDVYDYLFSKQWAYKDNTLKGTIKRLEYFLDEGLPANPRLEMLSSNARLSYCDYIPEKKVIAVKVEYTGNEHQELIGKTFIGNMDSSFEKVAVRIGSSVLHNFTIDYDIKLLKII